MRYLKTWNYKNTQAKPTVILSAVVVTHAAMKRLKFQETESFKKEVKTKHGAWKTKKVSLVQNEVSV